MVQRKAPIKLDSPTESKKNHAKPERPEETRSKGGGDLKKRMKKLRSIRASDLAILQGSSEQIDKPHRIKSSDLSPNYMKPTSSWDARRERPQVTIHSVSAIDKKNQTPKNSKNLNYSKPSTSAGSDLRSLKILSRKSSLKRARPSTKKKSTGLALMATCSSTLKDSKFPKALDLNPGGTEAEGTSVMKVCPFTYCSLNGHTHPPLPPLKCFMSARRKSLRTQKSLKLRGRPSFRVKGEKGIDTGQRMIEELPDDFFVEIYAKPQEHTVLEDDSIENVSVLDGLSPIQDVGEFTESGDGRDALNEMDESYSDDLDQGSDLSIEELDVMINFMEFVECDEHIEAEEENHPCSLPEDYEEWCFECCVFDLFGKDDEVLGESGSNISTFEATDIGSEEEISPSDIIKKDFSFESDITSTVCDIAYENAEQLLGKTDDGNSQSDVVDSNDSNERSGADIPFSCNGRTSDASDNLKQNELNDGLDQNPKPLVSEPSEENEQANELILKRSEPRSCEEKIYDSSFLGCDEEASDIFEGEGSGTADLEAMQNFNSESLEHSILSDVIEEEKNVDEEVEDTSSLLMIQLPESYQGSTETDSDIIEGDHIQIKLETEEYKYDEAIEDRNITPRIHSSTIDQSEQEEISEREGNQCFEINGMMQIEDDIESDADDICHSARNIDEYEKIKAGTANSNQHLTEALDNRKARMIIIRKKATEESEEMKEFNPRSPRFLPIEPDPEGEKVDLRHQMMDERRNSEDWMIDYALQHAVTKLAPARKRKVALLVEAFETVKPLAMYEEPLRHTTSCFAHSRAMQACS